MDQNKNLTLKKPKFSTIINTPTYQKLISNTLTDPKRAANFTASIVSTVAQNPALQECSANSVICAALFGESLKLSPSPQLGHYYLIPYDCTLKDKNGRSIRNPDGSYAKEKRAQFQMGYKGYMQLAIRSGVYRKLNVIPIKQGELIKYDRLEGDIVLNPIEDEDVWESAETVGYYAMFEQINGYRKALYWTKDKMERHADKYSPAFKREIYHKIINKEIPDKDMWKYGSFWYKDFDSMAQKTMLRQLISKYGTMSVDFQDAYIRDDAIINADKSYNFGSEFLAETPTAEPVAYTNATDPPKEPQNETSRETAGIEPPFPTDDDLPFEVSDDGEVISLNDL